MVLRVKNGVDLTPYIQDGGYSYQLNDLEAPNAGRTLDGIMHRGRVAQKVTLKITCMSLNTRDISIVLNAINPEFVEFEYLDPKAGGMVTKTFYSNNKPATCMTQMKQGQEMWSSFSFPLVER